MSYGVGKIIGYVNGKPVYEIKGGSEPTVAETAPEATQEPSQDDSAQGQPSENDGGTGEESGQKPYAQYLEGIPSSLIPTVEKAFQKWDADTGRKFQQVHSQYEPLKAYEKFASNKVDPAELEQAYTLLSRVREDPKGVFETLGQAFGFLGEQGQQGTNQPGSDDPDDEFSDETDSEGNSLADPDRQMVRTMAQFLVQQEHERRVAEASQQIDQEFAAAKEKYGDFPEELVIQLLQANPSMTVDDAVSQFNQVVEQHVAKRKAPPAPKILGAGGGMVSEPVDVSKMSPAERKKYVTERLAQANQE